MTYIQQTATPPLELPAPRALLAIRSNDVPQWPPLRKRSDTPPTTLPAPCRPVGTGVVSDLLTDGPRTALGRIVALGEASDKCAHPHLASSRTLVSGQTHARTHTT